MHTSLMATALYMQACLTCQDTVTGLLHLLLAFGGTQQTGNKHLLCRLIQLVGDAGGS